jgi:hypothetical protein
MICYRKGRGETKILDNTYEEIGLATCKS